MRAASNPLGFCLGAARLHEILTGLVPECEDQLGELSCAPSCDYIIPLANKSPEFSAVRVALPGQGAHVALYEWAPDELVRDFVAPPPSPDGAVSSAYYFAADCLEWKALLRRMAKLSLLGVLDASSALGCVAAGAFVVRKDESWDRLIADRRAANSCEGSIGYPYLPRVERLAPRELPGFEGDVFSAAVPTRTNWAASAWPSSSCLVVC